MRLLSFRRCTITFSYLGVFASSLNFQWKVPLGIIFSAVGLSLFIVTAIIAIRIHSMFPRKHESAYDFDRVMKEGPYAYCRHPFYLCLILNQASIPIIWHSLIGAIVFLAFLPAWWKLIIEEEKELLERFGKEYEEYMKEVPRIFPRIRRPKERI